METKDIGAYILYSDGTVFKKSSNRFVGGPVLNPDGYRLVCVYGKQVRVHRFIMEHFRPTPNSEHLTVNHKNGIKTDNRIENLEWCTRAENVTHAFRNGLMNSRVGTLNHQSKLTEADVVSIKRRIKTNEATMTQIAKEHNVTIQCISLIKRGKNWGHISAD